jgi:hypothetical protein
MILTRHGQSLALVSTQWNYISLEALSTRLKLGMAFAWTSTLGNLKQISRRWSSETSTKIKKFSS